MLDIGDVAVVSLSSALDPALQERARHQLIAPDRWLADFEKIAIRDEVRPLILKENALRLFGLS